MQNENNIIRMDNLPLSSKVVADKASALHKVAKEALDDFRSGKLAIQEVREVTALLKRALDAVKLEYLSGPKTIEGSMD